MVTGVKTGYGRCLRKRRKLMSKFEEHIRGLLSIYEGKVSVIVLAFIAFSGVAIWQAVKFHDAGQNIMIIILTLAGMIGGANGLAIVQKVNISDVANNVIGAINQEGVSNEHH
jgi:hypothetical protein